MCPFCLGKLNWQTDSRSPSLAHQHELAGDVGYFLRPLLKLLSLAMLQPRILSLSQGVTEIE